MNLWEALKLDMNKHRAVAMVGGGGKSSTMYALARGARDAGKRVVVTTTTHMMPRSWSSPATPAPRACACCWTGTELLRWDGFLRRKSWRVSGRCWIIKGLLMLW